MLIKNNTFGKYLQINLSSVLRIRYSQWKTDIQCKLNLDFYNSSMNSNKRLRPKTETLSYIFFRSRCFSFPLNFSMSCKQSFAWNNLFIPESLSCHFISKRFSCLLLLEIDDLKLIHSWKLSCVFITAEQVANNTY